MESESRKVRMSGRIHLRFEDSSGLPDFLTFGLSDFPVILKKLLHMSQPENLGSFIKENKTLLREYLETRLEIFRLSGIRASSKALGFLIWVLVSLFLLLIVFIFVGLVIAFWLSDITGSYVKGFGLTSLIFIVIFVLMVIMRNALFVNPAIKAVISKMHDNDSEDATEDSHF